VDIKDANANNSMTLDSLILLISLLICAAGTLWYENWVKPNLSDSSVKSQNSEPSSLLVALTTHNSKFYLSSILSDVRQTVEGG
jgi:hypothetical protein